MNRDSKHEVSTTEPSEAFLRDMKSRLRFTREQRQAIVQKVVSEVSVNEESESGIGTSSTEPDAGGAPIQIPPAFAEMLEADNPEKQKKRLHPDSY